MAIPHWDRWPKRQWSKHLLRSWLMRWQGRTVSFQQGKFMSCYHPLWVIIPVLHQGNIWPRARNQQKVSKCQKLLKMLQHLQLLNPPLKAMIQCVTKPPRNSNPQVVVCDPAVRRIPSWFSNIRDENRLCSTLLERNNNPKTPHELHRVLFICPASFETISGQGHHWKGEGRSDGRHILSRKKDDVHHGAQAKIWENEQDHGRDHKKGIPEAPTNDRNEDVGTKIGKNVSKASFGGRFQQVCFGISFANMEHPGHHTYNKSWQHSKKQSTRVCCCSLSSFMDVGQSLSL